MASRCGSWCEEYEVEAGVGSDRDSGRAGFSAGHVAHSYSGGSSAGHNGIESIIGALGTQDFLRIRIGVAPERKIGDGAKYVLAPMRKPELEIVDGVLDTAEEAVKVILKEGPAAAMNRFNRKPDEAKD